MELAKQDKIIAIKGNDGKVIGFHTENLQVARLDEMVWSAIAPTQSQAHQLSQDVLTEIKEELQTWNSEVDTRAQDVSLPQAVRSLSINIAQICNLACSYCAAGGDGTFGDPVKHVDLKTVYEQIRMFLHDVPSGESFQIRFFGGEPLLAPDTIRQIARFARLQIAGRGIQLSFSIITNGTLVTPEIAELLASINCHVTVSIDGPPEVNDRYRKTRGGKGSTERTLEGLKNLKNVHMRLASLCANSVFGKHNTDVMSTYLFLREFGFDSIQFEFAGDKDDDTASEAYAKSLLETADFVFAQGGERELRKIMTFETYFRILDQQRRIQNHCGAGKSALLSDSRGKLTSCPWFVGDKAEELGQGVDINFDRLSQHASPLTELNGCQTCWARNLCGGGCMYINKLKTGSKHQKDETFCIRTRTTIAKAVELYGKTRELKSEGSQREVH